MATFSELLTILSDYLDEQIKIINPNSSFYYYSDIHSTQEPPKGCVFPIKYTPESTNIDIDYTPYSHEITYQIRLMVSSIDSLLDAQTWTEWLSDQLHRIKKDGISSDYGNLFFAIEIDDFLLQYGENQNGGLTSIIVTKIKYCLD